MRSHAASSDSSTSGAPAAPPSFEIKILGIDGSSQRVEVKPDMTGLQLKEVISQKLGISMEQRLICRGRAIKDDDLLGAHVTENGQTVHMVQRPPVTVPPGSTPPVTPGAAAALGGRGPMGQPPVPGPGMMTSLPPFLEVFHIAVPDFMGGLGPLGPGHPGHPGHPGPPGPPMPPTPPGQPAPAGAGPGGPGPPFGVNMPDRMPGGVVQLMQAVEAAQAAWRMDAPRPPPAMVPPALATPTMRGIPLVPTGFPHPVPPHVPLPPPMAPVAFGPPAPAAMPPPHFPPPMPAPMHVVLQGFPPQGLAQVIPQMLAPEAAVPPPPRGVPGGTRPPETLPWRDLRRLHSHLTVALGRSSGYRPGNLPPDGLAPQAEMRAFLTSLHAATSQLGVAVSDLIQNSESLMGDGPPSRQQTQFNLVLGSASRLFRSLSNVMSTSHETGTGTAGTTDTANAARPGEAPPAPVSHDSGVGQALAPVALRCGLQPLELLQSSWQEALPSVACPEHLTRAYVFAFLQEVERNASNELVGTPDAAERYPHLNSLVMLR